MERSCEEGDDYGVATPNQRDPPDVERCRLFECWAGKGIGREGNCDDG